MVVPTPSVILKPKLSANNDANIEAITEKAPLTAQT